MRITISRGIARGKLNLIMYAGNHPKKSRNFSAKTTTKTRRRWARKTVMWLSTADLLNTRGRDVYVYGQNSNILPLRRHFLFPPSIRGRSVGVGGWGLRSRRTQRTDDSHQSTGPPYNQGKIQKSTFDGSK